MFQQNPPENSRALWKSILTDAHFWIPVVVLAAGLAVLHWIR